MGLNEFFSDESSIVFTDFERVVDKSLNIIKVIGVGGGGGNAVENMFEKGVTNVSFAVVNTDSQALSKSKVPCKLQIGQNGLGVGGRPELGREAAEYSIDSINKLFDDQTKMVFITAGMGGGTGTGAAPTIANAAREKGILTVGVVTLPFAFEKRLRIEKALKGVEELKANVDALLVINNERLIQIYTDGMTTIDEAFEKADEIVTIATKSIAEIITQEGKVNRDFCDVQTVMKDGGGALMSEGRASGEHRIMKAMANALKSPLLNNLEVEKSQKLLYIIYQSHKNPVLITELNEVNKFMDKMANDLEVLWGLYWDDSLEEDVKVNIIATGFDKDRVATAEERDKEREEMIRRLIAHYYPPVESDEDDEVCEESHNHEVLEVCNSVNSGIREFVNSEEGTEVAANEEDVKVESSEESCVSSSDDEGCSDEDAPKEKKRNTWIDKLIAKAKELMQEEDLLS